MAKMFTNVKFTAAEKRAIEAGWYALDSIANRNGSSCAQALADTLRHETTGSQSVPQTFAHGMICEWAARYFRCVPPPRDLLGTRSMLIACMVDYASNVTSRGVTSEEIEAIRQAGIAKQNAFDRRPR